MGPVKKVLSMKKCLLNPVKDHCRPVSAGLLSPIVYFMYDTSTCRAFCLVTIKMHQYKNIHFKAAVSLWLVSVDSGNVISEGGEISFQLLLSTTVLIVWMVHDGCVLGIVQSLMCVPLKCVISHMLCFLTLMCVPLKSNCLIKRSF